MDSLLGIDRNDDEDDYLDVLGTLIRDYDLEHHPVPTLTQASVLRSLMEDRGITQAQLARETGIADSNINRMLSNQQGISRRCCLIFGNFGS